MKTNSLLLLVAAAAGAAGLVWYFKTSSAADAATAAPATGPVDVAGAPAGAATGNTGSTGGLLDGLTRLLFGNTATDNTAPTTLTSSLASGLTSGTQTTTPGTAVSPPPGPPAYDLYTVKQLAHGTLVTYFAFDSTGKKSQIGTAFRPAPQGETIAQRTVRLKITAPPAGTTNRPAAPAPAPAPTGTTGTAAPSNAAIRAAAQATPTIGTYYELPNPPTPPVSTIGQPSNVRIKHTRPGGAA